MSRRTTIALRIVQLTTHPYEVVQTERPDRVARVRRLATCVAIAQARGEVRAIDLDVGERRFDDYEAHRFALASADGRLRRGVTFVCHRISGAELAGPK